MTNITIVSPFRDCSAEVNHYIERVEAIEFGGMLRVVCVEGDSLDDTRQKLQMWANVAPWVSLVRCDVNKPKYGSVVHPERFEILATVFNAGLDAVDLAWSDYVLFLPCDIAYQPDLLARLLAANKDVIAPFSWQYGTYFYDTWAFIDCSGRMFSNFPRSEITAFGDRPVEMTAVGGTMLIDADVLRVGVRYRKQDVDRGFCALAREHGFHVYADPTTHVVH